MRAGIRFALLCALGIAPSIGFAQITPPGWVEPPSPGTDIDCYYECLQHPSELNGDHNPCLWCDSDRICAKGRDHLMQEEELCCEMQCGGRTEIQCTQGGVNYTEFVVPAADCQTTCGTIQDASLCQYGACYFGGSCVPNIGGLPGSPVCMCAVCGDGITTSNEQCDDGKQCTDGSACESQGDCWQLDDTSCLPRNGDGCTSECVSEGCGDGIFDKNGIDNIVGNNDDEECEDTEHCTSCRCDDPYEPDGYGYCVCPSEYARPDGSCVMCPPNKPNYDPVSGRCTECYLDIQCGADDACTDRACVNNVCTETRDPFCCLSNADCNDRVACTSDYCDTDTNECVFADSCEPDGDDCTERRCNESTGVCEEENVCCTSDAECQSNPWCNQCQSGCSRNQCYCNTSGQCDVRVIDDTSCTQGACNPWPPPCGDFGEGCGGAPEESCQWCVIEFWDEDGAGHWQCDPYPNAETLWPDQCGPGGGDGGSSPGSSAGPGGSSESDSFSWSSMSEESSASSSEFASDNSLSTGYSASSLSSTSSGDSSISEDISSAASSTSSVSDGSSSETADSVDDGGFSSEGADDGSLSSGSSSSYDQCDFCPACVACRRCGIGLFNICDEAECAGLGLCVYQSGVIDFGVCYADPDVCSVCQ